MRRTLTLVAVLVGVACSDGSTPFSDSARETGESDIVVPADVDMSPDVLVTRDTGSATDVPTLMDADDDAGDGMNGWMPETGPRCDASMTTCTPGPTGCGTMEICDDGIDNNCNRSVDEGCACLPGMVQSCFGGPPRSRRVGACADGTQRCLGTGEFGTWGACTGGISPSAETCDMLDNDCNGCADEGLCCGGVLSCPGPGDPRVPTGRPFETVTIDGATFYPGAAMAWSWEIQGGPCEAVLPTPTFTTGSLTGPRLQFTPELSGDYTVTVRVTTSAGTVLTCTFIVHIGGEGLRVELCWRPATGTAFLSDLDLYLHEPDTTTPWFSGPGSVVLPGITLGTSCNWANCGPVLRSGLPRVSWGEPPGPLLRCSAGPGGPTWTLMGSCPNPRIDLDGHGLASEARHGYIENINADSPRDGQSFRVMVHDCSGPATNPLVNVYCGGFLRATIGAAPTLVTLPGSGSCSANLDTIWRVGDVRVRVDAAGVTTGCDVTPLRAPGGGARLTRGDLAY